MMNIYHDRYCECMVFHKPGGLQKVLVFLPVGVFIASFAGGIYTQNSRLWLVAVAFGVFAFASLRNFSREYEYQLLNNQMTVDCIFWKRRRRTMILYSLDQALFFGKSNSAEFRRYMRDGAVYHDFSAGESAHESYGLVCRKGEKTSAMCFSPNEEMVHMLLQTLPSEICKK